MKCSRNITVLGSGSYGSALAAVLARNGHQVSVWGRNAERIAAIADTNTNPTYLPGIDLPAELHWTSDPDQAAAKAELAVVAAPSRYFRDMCRQFAGKLAPTTPVLSVAKGLDPDDSARMTEVAAAELGCPASVLSGPSHAEEVAKGAATAVTVAAASLEDAAVWQKLFNNRSFRVYTSDDVVGVELGGVLKNVIAIAAGVVDGLAFGDNAKAALITRGLAEMRRIGEALGARGDTFTGLSGLGDLIVTCGSQLSRNRGVGERIGRGEKIDDIIASMEQVAEGYWNAATVAPLAAELGISAPISQEVYAILYDGKSPLLAVEDLMMRQPRSE